MAALVAWELPAILRTAEAPPAPRLRLQRTQILAVQMNYQTDMMLRLRRPDTCVFAGQTGVRLSADYTCTAIRQDKLRALPLLVQLQLGNSQFKLVQQTCETFHARFGPSMRSASLDSTVVTPSPFAAMSSTISTTSRRIRIQSIAPR